MRIIIMLYFSILFRSCIEDMFQETKVHFDPEIKTIQNVNEQENLTDFIFKLKSIIKKRDSDSLKYYLSDNIKCYGDIVGIQNFYEYWGLNKDNNDESYIWTIFDRLLKMPGKKINSNTYITPIYSLQTNKYSYNQMIVTENTKIYENPSLTSKIISKIDSGTITSYPINDFNTAVLSSLNETFINFCDTCFLEIESKNYNGYILTNKLWDFNTGLILILHLENGLWKVNSIGE